MASQKSYQGVRFTASASHIGANKRGGAPITYWIKEILKPAKTEGDSSAKKEMDKKDQPDVSKVRFDVVDASGDTIRTFTTKPDTFLNRYYWNMARDGYHWPSRGKRDEKADAPSGARVRPGTYTVHLTYGTHKAQTKVTLLQDPRRNVTEADYEAKEQVQKRLEAMVTAATNAFDRLKEAKKVIAAVNKQMEYLEKEEKEALGKLAKGLSDSIAKVEAIYFTPQGQKGLDHVTQRLIGKMGNASSYMNSATGAMSSTGNYAMQEAEKMVQDVLDQVNVIFSGPWVEYQQKVEAANFKHFKPYEPIEISK